jgi:CheY-like chemotaxis protein
MVFKTIMTASQSPGIWAGPTTDEHKACHRYTANIGAVLDVSLGMTTTTPAVAPRSRRKLMNPPLPKCEISGPVARKIPRRVLVVDDEPLIRWSVAETLSGIGLDVEQASDAASALAIMTTGPLEFDVIVLDLRLPDMHDLSLLATMRQLQPAASIVLMTAFGTDEIIERAIGLGAGSVLHKPFELGSLVDAVYGVSA